MRQTFRRRAGTRLLAGLMCAATTVAVADQREVARFPNIFLITVDPLRADHLSGYGYDRLTSPNIDRLMQDGVRFGRARTVVPLTCPALSSMFTTVYPHLHGSTRNGIPIRAGMTSFPKVFAQNGYSTAAFVSNWALQNRLCGLAEHFDEWEEVLVRRQWVFSKREADASDVTAEALSWLEDYVGEPGAGPFLLWVHYMDPHSPYVLRRDFLEQLEIGDTKGFFSLRNRYDTEIAFVDHHIGNLLDRAGELLDLKNTLILFTSDHGESLGDHGYWGHGKHVYENALHIPLSITWQGRIEPGQIQAPALITDVAPTLLALAGFAIPEPFAGLDWTSVLHEAAAEPLDRVTYHQAHRGTVQPSEDPTDLRRKGLLEVGRIEADRKEVLVLRKDRRQVFDLNEDREESNSLVPSDSAPTEELVTWLEEVRSWLGRSDELPPPGLEDEDVERLKSLGYVD
jgi:arylsulfatase A-like enzyme